MWLYILAFFLLIFGIGGSIVSGGIFTIVLLPLGIIALVTAIGMGAFSRSEQGRHGASTHATPSTGRPLPTGHSNTPSAPSTPDDLTEARRVQQ
jgi:hypothetical protein